jgi:hypothetical protein
MHARVLTILLATQPVTPPSSRRNLGRPALIALLLAVVALALGATSALASGFSLKVAARGPATVGEPLLLDVTGTIPPEDIKYPYWFSMAAIPTTVLSSCPADHWTAHQIAISTGGAMITFDQRESADAAGNFGFAVGATPTAAGTVLMCGYTDDGETQTLAVAQLLLHIRPGRPVNVSKPRVKRAHGRLVCRPGRWVNGPTSITHRWRVKGSRVSCVVTARNAAGAAKATSRPVSASRALRHRLS